MRLVSNMENIKEKLAIYEIENPQKEILDYLKIQKLPSLFLIVHEYENKSRY